MAHDGIFFDDIAIMSEEEYLQHYGTPRHSGRYPWGSGENPYQGDDNFLSYVRECREKGISDRDIYRAMGMNSSQFRQKISQYSAEYQAYQESMCVKLREKGMGWTAIGRRLGIPESTVRSYVNRHGKDRRTSARQIADQLKSEVDEYGYLDVGSGTEQWLKDATATKLNNAVALLKEEGYSVYSNVFVKQMGTDHRTTFKVLAKPGTTWQDVQKHRSDIHHLHEDFYTDDQAHTLRRKERPVAVDSSRIQVKYNEEGGIDKDGLIELRRGVDDISLGEAKYAQVRINVDGTHYLKGMAMYADDLPDGVDIRFNTNKHVGTPLKGIGDKSVLKPLKTTSDGSIDWENPFGAAIHEYDAKDISKAEDSSLVKNGLIRAQRHYIGADGKEHLSALNIVNEEGTWSNWDKITPSQFLSKQSPALAKQQLDIQYQISKNQLDEIVSYNNPTVRKELLRTFASECDANATDLHGAPFPGQTTKVLLPFTDVKDNEIYAPNLPDGTHVALVRFPHGGIFEIPTLTVNNRAKGPNKAIENAIDAVGISKNTADKLSGADFDGDTALVIPIDNVNIKTASLDSPGFERLKGFDPKEEYKGYDGMKKLEKKNVGTEMGKISNLITDMTIKGAPPKDIAEAVRHSMVVIDANKHDLDYKRSEIDHHIAELKSRYQGGPRNGASTLISQSTKVIRNIPSREEKAYSTMTPEEKERYMKGEVIWRETGYSHNVGKKNADGETVWTRVADKTSSPMMMETNNAYSLVSRDSDGSTTRIESIYADYANKQKALANKARAILRSTEDIKRDPVAAKAYSEEVKSLLAKLNEATKNKPLERHAQILANKKYSIWAHDNQDADADKKRKVRGMMLDDARRRVGAKKKQVVFTSKEWEAINAGAVSSTTLIPLIRNADPRNVQALALPKEKKTISSAKIARAKSLLNSHYTQAEVADMLGVSVSGLLSAMSEQR